MTRTATDRLCHRTEFDFQTPWPQISELLKHAENQVTEGNQPDWFGSCNTDQPGPHRLRRPRRAQEQGGKGGGGNALRVGPVAWPPPRNERQAGHRTPRVPWGRGGRGEDTAGDPRGDPAQHWLLRSIWHDPCCQDPSSFLHRELPELKLMATSIPFFGQLLLVTPSFPGDLRSGARFLF